MRRGPYGWIVGAYFHSNDSEAGPDRSWNSVLPTLVSPQRGRDCRFFVAALLRMTAGEEFLDISSTLNNYRPHNLGLMPHFLPT